MRLSNLLFFLAFFFTVIAASSQKIVIKIAGITPTNGELVKALEFKTEADVTYTTGGGAAVGKALPGKLLIKKDLDTTTSEFLRRIVTGVHFPEVVFEYISDNNSKPITTYIITLTNAFVTEIQWLTPECPGCLALEHQVGFVFTKIKFDDPIRKKVITYNVPQNKIE